MSQRAQRAAGERQESTVNRDEAGAGTVLTAGLALSMLLLLAVVLGLGQAAVAAAKAAKAADLAALSAADAYRGLAPGDPCDAAADVAARNGAVLTACSLGGDLSVLVKVSVGSPLPWPATGLARAGPPPDTVQPGSH